MKKLLLLVIVLFGFYLRARAAMLQSFWGDETSIFIVSIRNSLKSLIFLEHWDKCHPQLFYVFLHFWQKISTNTIFLRIPSLLAFFPTIFFIYKISKKTGGFIMAILASLFFATSHFFVNLGFQQKMYAFEMMFMFGTIYWMQLFFNTESKKSKILFIIFSVLGFYTDYSFVWLWISIFITLSALSFMRIFSKKTLLAFLKMMIVASLFMSLQSPIIFGGLGQALGLEAYSGVPNYETIRNTVAKYMGLINLNPYDLLIVVTISLSSIYFAKKSKQKKAIILIILALSCFFVTLPTSYFISQKHPIFIPRNLLVATFIFVFLAPYVISQIKNKYLKIVLAIIFLIYVSIITSISLKLKDGFQGRDEWTEIHETAKKINGPITLVVVSDRKYALDALREYYFDGFYDGSVIKNYKVVWITKEDLINELYPPITSITNNIILIKDPLDKDDLSLRKRAKLRSKICENKTCSGFFALQ